MRNKFILLSLTVFLLSNCTKYESTELIKKSVFDFLFEDGGIISSNYRHNSNSFNLTINSDDIETIQPAGSIIINGYCYPFLKKNSYTDRYTNNLSLSKTDNALTFRYDEFFKDVYISANSNKFDVNCSPYDLVIPLNTPSHSSHSISRNVNLYYQDNFYAWNNFEEDVTIDFTYQLERDLDLYLDSDIYKKGVTEIRIGVVSQTLSYASFGNFHYSYYFDYEDGLIAISINGNVYNLE